MIHDSSQTKALTKILSGELFKALGFPSNGLISRAFSPLVWNPIHQFSEIAVGFDVRVKDLGFQQASRWILPLFIQGMSASGTDSIPPKGPLLIASNHPGAYDTLVITANIPRDDIKIIVNIPLDFIKQLTATRQYFLYAPPDPYARIKVVRSGIKHLKNGGALLLFASGGMDPDPASMPGADNAIRGWSRSLEFFLRRVPETQLLISIVSGIISPKYTHHIFTHFRKKQGDKQRISEFFQVMRQILNPERFQMNPRVSFAKSVYATAFLKSRMSPSLMDTITLEAKHVLENHILHYPTNPKP